METPTVSHRIIGFCFVFYLDSLREVRMKGRIPSAGGDYAGGAQQVSTKLDKDICIYMKSNTSLKQKHISI